MAKYMVQKAQTPLRREKLRLTENGRFVLANRYLQKAADGSVGETAEELFGRVARAVAQAERGFGAAEGQAQEWEVRFYNLMATMRFLPNSPTLMNAGRTLGMLSACFVLPIEDSIDGIFETVKNTATIQKAGGGTGFSFDRLRPTGDYISSSGGKTSGPISFWRVLSETTNAIQQGAFRRGANMGMMSLTHPDILKFLHAKQDLGAFTNYNISVKVSDAWMQELEKEPDGPHEVINPRTGKKYYLPRGLDIWKYEIGDLIEADADRKEAVWTRGEIWRVVVKNAHATGEPGLAFIDRINRDNPTPQLGAIEATNPCGEQPLLPYEACNLGSVNLARFVAAEKEQGQGEVLGRMDLAALRETVHEAVRFLDDVIEVNNYQIGAIEQICRANRKIGLGVMGFADALYELGIPYDSEEAVKLGGEVMRFINEEAHQASEELARERGCFANWQGSLWEQRYQRRQRNATVTTVAPTGTLSIIANCSGGIEPMYAVAFMRHVLGGAHLPEVNANFKRVAQERGFYDENLMQRIAETGSLANIDEIPEDVKRVFVCAHDIRPEWHVRMQAAFQEHCDASISKTINFPQDATVEEVDRIFRLAYRLGCKGITVYRDGCRRNQPMSHAGVQESGGGEAGGGRVKPLEPVSLPEIMSCIRVRQATPFGNMHVKISVDPRTDREMEVFAQLGKGGDIANSDLEAICRLLSLLLRCGGSLELAIRQLEGIGSSITIPAREGRIGSLGDGLAKALEKYLVAKGKHGLRALLLGETDSEGKSNFAKTENRDILDSSRTQGKAQDGTWGHTGLNLFKLRCPSCGGIITFMEGCAKCLNCGYTQC